MSTAAPPSPATVSDSSPAELLPGYTVEDSTGAWLTLPHTVAELQAMPSLGWGVIEWAGVYLVHHLTGEPWSYRPEQVRFLIAWYAVTPEGRWRYRSGVKRGAKGTGKDPFLATLALAELCGPTRLVRTPSGWHGERHRLPLVQIGANSEAQAGDVLRVANAMVGADLAAEVDYDGGALRSQIGSGGRIELLTRSERSNEGDPATAIFLNETHHMTEASGGQGLAAVARRNAAKSPGGMARVLELTNAHMPGEGSVAEESFDAWQAQAAGRTRLRDILYDSREAPPHLSLHREDELEAGIRAAYADAPWVDVERIKSEALDLRIPPADSVRFYFNSLPTNEHAWVDPRAWDSLVELRVVADRDPIAVFLDCSKSEAATTLAACRITDGYVFALGGWQRPHGERGKTWLAPRHEVDAAVRLAFDRWDVQWFGVDPSPTRDDDTEALYWSPLIDQWHRDFRTRVLAWATPGQARGSAVLFDMRLSAPGGADRNREFTLVAELTASEIDERSSSIAHDGDAMMRTHVHNARRRPNQWGVSLGKQSRGSSKLVDYAVTMVGARLGRRRLLAQDLTRGRQRSGRVV